MPETKERDPKHSFVDWIEFLKETVGDIFGVRSWMFTDEPFQTENRRDAFRNAHPKIHERTKTNVKQNKRTSRRCRV